MSNAVKSLLVFISFIAWLVLYLLELRPLLLDALAPALNAMSIGFPAMLHLIPIFGLPIAVLWLASIFLRKRPSLDAKECK